LKRDKLSDLGLNLIQSLKLWLVGSQDWSAWICFGPAGCSRTGLCLHFVVFVNLICLHFFLNVIFFCLLGQILEKYIWKCKFFLSGNLSFVFKLFVVVLNYFDFYKFPFDKFV